MKYKPQRTGGEIEEVIEQYKNTVYGLALAKTGSRSDADDVYQEVFLAYFRSNKDFADEEHRKAWLLRTTINMSRRVTHSTWRKKTVPLSAEEKISDLFSESLENHIWSAVSSLPDDYRIPIYLFYFQGLSSEEIANILSVRAGTIRTRLSRGREKLREILKGDYFDER